MRTPGLSTVEDLARLIEQDRRLADWSIRDRGAGYLEVSHGEVILVLAWPVLWRDREALEPHLCRARSGNYSLILFGNDTEFGDGAADEIGGEYSNVTVVALPAAATRLVTVIKAWTGAYRLRMGAAAAELALERARYENDLLIDIGRALSQQRDLAALLHLILQKAREVTGADAGSVYIVEGSDQKQDEHRLRFTESQNDSVPMSGSGFTMAVSPSSIVGACVLSGEIIDIPDLYALDSPGTGNNPWGFVHDRSLDNRYGYQTRSMVTVPMISARRQVIGVIQLINKRARGVVSLREPTDFETKVLPFDDVSIRYARSLASQAGIALENAKLYEEVRTLFEGFVHASVTAIEARDPTTSGHSVRVADLTVELARVADRIDTGPYADLRFARDDIKQIEYAALLHDFGKVGVREHVLVKPQKLYEHERQLIESRFDFIRRTLEVEQLKAKVKYLLEAERDRVAEQLAALDRATEDKLREIDDFIAFVLKCNQPTVLEKAGFERIAEIAARRYVGIDGAERPYLAAEEAAALQIARGSLTERERLEIESHVVHTFKFLTQIPWGETFRNVPVIAGAHHEKLDGTGYPHGLRDTDIPPAAKMMTISDIYDALTASDRPYKRAVPVEKALDILADEVKRGKLDAALYALFTEAKVYRVVQGP